MHRIDTVGATEDNKFKASPQPSTRLGADWHNAVQEEICNVIESPEGGGADLAKPNNAQLLAAIKTVVANGLIGGIAITPGATGQITLLDAVTIKWGGFREVITDEVTRAIGFDVPFTSACWRVFTQPVVISGGDKQDLWTQVVDFTVSVEGFSVQFQDSDSDDNRSYGLDWWAIGI